MRHDLLALLLAACTSDAGEHLGQADGVTGLDVVDVYDGNALGCGPVGYSPGPRLVWLTARGGGGDWILDFTIDHDTGDLWVLGSLSGATPQTPAPMDKNVVTIWHGCAHSPSPGIIAFETTSAPMQPYWPMPGQSAPPVVTVALAGTLTQHADSPLLWSAEGTSEALTEDGVHYNSLTGTWYGDSIVPEPDGMPRVCSNAPCNFAAVCLYPNWVRPPSCFVSR